ncbi:MAG: YbhB/YbcL family Raf kinase inhibitor-like protein [Candidatus Liptonbacteria bacterium]|nr:YbhB/YbcL family Raf kinase inhibitor-like protein [Candidatus Liptonbacteria bacterium]
MKFKIVLYVIIFLLVVVAGILTFWKNGSTLLAINSKAPVKKSSMNISSVEFKNNEPIPAKFTCQGNGINPELKISGVPAKAKSLALIVDDPDAPMGTFTHWLVWNIGAKTTVVNENSIPGIEGANSAGKKGYTGPCPPNGTHRYFFKFYALDSMLDLGAEASKSQLESEIAKHELERAELLGIYKKF